MVRLKGRGIRPTHLPSPPGAHLSPSDVPPAICLAALPAHQPSPPQLWHGARPHCGQRGGRGTNSAHPASGWAGVLARQRAGGWPTNCHHSHLPASRPRCQGHHHSQHSSLPTRLRTCCCCHPPVVEDLQCPKMERGRDVLSCTFTFSYAIYFCTA